MAFGTEEDLSLAFLKTKFISDLANARGYESAFDWEPGGLFGVPDLLIGSFDSTGHQTPRFRLFAFEMKLANWSRALKQAFRYRTFANQSFVVMDAAYVHRALPHLRRFQKADIGLLSVAGGEVVQVHVLPEFRTPYSTRLHNIVREKVLRVIGERELWLSKEKEAACDPDCWEPASYRYLSPIV